MSDDFDIIIIGAGIAGTACALRCARAGLSVLLLERGELPGSKNLSGGRLYTHALGELLPHFQHSAPLERRITQENLSLLTRDGATTYSSLQPDGDSWSLLRARFDPWFVAQAEAEGVQFISGVTVEALHIEEDRICGVIADNETLRARYVVLAEGANSVLAERYGFLPRPSTAAMALGIKETLALDKTRLEERFRLSSDEGAAMLFSGEICGERPGGAFLYTNQETLSLGVVCPLSSLAQSDVPAAELLERLKTHPALYPLLRGSETLEYGAHLVPEGGLHSLPVKYAGDGWLLVGDALRSCVNTGFSVRGMDMALIGAQAAAQTLINACRKREPQNLFPAYHHDIQHSLLWDVLQRYRDVPALLQRPGWYRQWPMLMEAISREIWHQGNHPVAPLRQIVWRQFRRHGLRHLAGDIIRSLRCL
ncbi:FAD-dependent oxidoreductase [Citrobacter amalonaticus]|uniref:Protein FixC n=1 Tax=Citrobacter amalonaticus TaxID=35703 RepID=A0A2S4RVY0_CITAM|nr:FAD-dependent oxidoreductase [Citrobacter amalonaticus]POT56458.1 FAD-dependent oxidoreductase [Citrobacter amalonaticus]POT74983.1 FAD-dependent oxidoreductase [Citrobacter amalonaticus]POU64512.1 FAD-dependent oxidoreductase [Citrobacter amalonaticus]POV04348.1 FAD-dependent oxidoreductase [Citrobacter amalonaticus]